MSTTIPHIPLKLIKNLLFTLCLIVASAQASEAYSLRNAKRQKISLRIAITKEQHTQGLSGLKEKDFSTKEGMLFVNNEVGARRFWMPDTYFNLDIIFLDPQLKIVAIEKNVPAHAGMKEPPTIYQTATYQAQFVLETRWDCPFSKNLKVNDQLTFIGSTSLLEIARGTRLLR